eukprot:1195629-Prorocentrum_minimum.AAC.8
MLTSTRPADVAGGDNPSLTKRFLPDMAFVLIWNACGAAMVGHSSQGINVKPIYDEDWASGWANKSSEFN